MKVDIFLNTLILRSLFIAFLPMLYLSLVDLKLAIHLQHSIDVIFTSFFILMGSLFITNEVRTRTLISDIILFSIFHVPELKLWKIIRNTFRYTVQLNNLMQDTSKKKSVNSLTESQRIGDTRNTVKAASSQRLSLFQ